MNNSDAFTNLEQIAVIGMAGRFPGAKNIDIFWQNIQEGVESISFFTDDELASLGIAQSLLNNPNYIKASAILSDIDLFDAAFFGFSPSEAEIKDPQHRLFLECAWEALENAGYDSATYKGQIGIYAGAGLSTYTLFNLYPNREFLESVSELETLIRNDKDFLPTLTSYKLNLRGPSINIQTACSTSLVAIHLACQSLLNGESDMALAGGVRVRTPQKAGYLYQKEGISSPDGHCRAFDAKAQGTVSGNGVGVVVLKRLEDALGDGDCIHAIIKGSAINNDGSLKIGYTAPSINGQAQAIREALAVARISPETVSYIETHGTGTPLGDPIEIAALNQVFGHPSNKKSLCAIGSLKTNIGHLDAAAGVAGLIKTVLALKQKLIPPSLHFESPNPQIDFANSPFYVNNTLSEWKANGNPRRAGVSSFGIGGTNAHVILEEAPLMEASVPSRPWQLLMLSAKTESALEMITANIAEHFRHNQEINLADVAYTLQVGRKGFDHRRMVVCQNLNDAIESLSLLDPQRVFTRLQKPCDRPVAFMFPGLGTHYVNMAIELYQSEPTFRGEVDRCCELLKVNLGLDLRDVLYPNRNIEKVKLEPQKHNTLSANLDLRKMLGRSSGLADVETLQATFLLNQTFLAQPAIFVIEYALAKLWIEWGIRPVAMIGYSIGEYVAACLAEVLSLEQALTLVAKRAQLIQDLPGGAMLAVPVSEKEIQPLLNESLSLSAINGSSLCVIGGTTAAVEELEQQLTQKGLVCRRLQTTHAFHSVMMNEKAPALRDLVKTFNLKPPKIPYLSNVTGVWITADEATDPNYWVKHLCEPVQFASGIQQLWEKQNPILLEVGPGQTLCSLALQCRENDLKVNRLVLPCLRHSYDSQSDMALLLSTLGQLWLFGIEINWSGFYAHERRHRLPLPTYPFERQRYWIEPNLSAPAVTKKQEPLHKKPNIADWFYIPVWKQSIPLESFENGNLVKQKSCWLVFVDAYGVGAEIAERLEKQGKNTITVLAGEGFTRLSDHSYAINPQQRDDYDALLTELRDRDLTPQAIAHFWSITSNTQTQSRIEFSKNCQNLGFFSVLFLAQVLGEQQFADRLDRLVVVVTNDIHNVTGEEKLSPEKVTVLGPCKVIPAEYPNITCRSVDVVIPELGTWQQKKLVDQLIAELTMESTDLCIAYRGQHRWVQTFEAVRWERGIPEKTRLREKGVYLITGGFGGMGMALAEYLAQTVQAKLVLIGRSALPLTEEWGQWLATHDDLDQVSRKILKVQALEELGAEVLVCNADVAHEEQMRVAIAKASDRFGEIHGVIHAAGIGGGGLIQFQTPEKVASIFASKVTGTQVLDILFQDVQLDFFVLCSSQISILGGPGRVEYCAANAFQDAFAHRNTYKNGKFTVSINWDTWVDVGMAVDEALRQNLKPEEVLRNAIFSKEGVDAFSRILCRTLPQVVVSPENFHALIEQSNNNTASKALEKIEKARPSKPTHPKPQLSNSYVAPRNKVEQTLADIWQQLLGIEQVGIHDNFFNLGGDSDVGIQIIARANQAGFQITSKHIFEYQTIAELAEVAGKTQIIQAEQDLVKGPLPLAPNQQWFFEQNQPDPHHWNMAIGLEILQTLDPLLLEQGVRQLLLHHDALRLRFMRSESSWQQVNSSAEEVVPFTRLDFSVLLPDEQKLAIEAAANELQASLNLSTGPIVRVALFDLGVHQPNRLLIVIHHLVVDFGSWRILLEDLQTAYQQLSRGEAIHLPQKTTSFKQWSFRLQEYAHSAELQTELDYWLSKPYKQVFSLPVDYPEGINTVASAQSVSVELSAEETQALLQKVPSVSRTQTEEVLLTALVQAFAQWTGENSLLVDLEGNGRETTLDGINISRTVGWFTTISPVLLNIEKAENPDNALKIVKEQFRRISNGGIDYGALHYLREDPEITKQLRALPQAEVIFVYLGQLVKSGPESSLFRLAGEFSGATRSPRGTRSHLLQVTGSVTEGQMRIEWKYSENLHRQATVEVLAERFRSAVQSLIIYCQSSEAIGDTASDFERVSLIRFVRPRDTLELQIAQIWSEILDVHPVGVLDNFFALGGHSILALRLMARIQQQFGKNLPLTTLFQGPTVEHMATLLRQQTNSPSWSTLVALQPDGSKQPFFCIHPGGATVLAYIDLARHLGSEQPFYGLESLGLDEEQKPYTRIEEMAAHYIKAMQTVQPQGPYLLGGWSFGGLVAFEIAQQLKAQGQQVSLLALLDTPAPMSVPMSVEELQDEEYVVLLAKELANDHSLSLNLDCIRQLRADEQLSYVIEQVKYANRLIPDFDLPQARRIMRVFKSHKKVSNSYRPQPYPGKIAFFQAIEEVEPGFHNLLLGWRELADERVEIHWVPGNHNNMVKEPHVQVLAEELGACLKQSQADD